ncbi:MAG: hypothetical protein Kow00128_07290 [Deltaproteobacteria bacterium]
MKRAVWVLGVLLVLGLAGSASAAEFKFHGDLNNRFMVYTDQARMFGGAETVKTAGVVDKDGVDESWGEVKYRLWAEAATDDGKVKGVYAIELGAVKFGDSTKGGAFSGDGINIETRWAYTDFQLPWTESKARVSIGLIPFSVNSFVWVETAMGVQLAGSVNSVDYKLAWIRGMQNFNNDKDDDLFEDLDALLGRVDFKPAEGAKAGLFVLYEGRNPGKDDIAAFASSSQYQVKRLANVDFDLYTFGLDGSYGFGTSIGKAFVNWDLIYQTGSLDDSTPKSYDVSAYLAHADLGVNFGNAKLTYTIWYASGDDNSGDNDIDNFLSTDVDRFDSVIFMEGGYTDDNYFTEAPYILDKGLFLNKLALDYKASDKTKVGLAVLYLQTAEDLTIGGGKTEKALGTEIDAYLSYKLFASTEFALNLGYLVADDAMDAFENNVDGQSDNDVFRSTARVRYKF